MNWANHVKTFAKEHSMKFGDALSNAECKAAYHANKTKKSRTGGAPGVSAKKLGGTAVSAKKLVGGGQAEIIAAINAAELDDAKKNELVAATNAAYSTA